MNNQLHYNLVNLKEIVGTNDLNGWISIGTTPDLKNWMVTYYHYNEGGTTVFPLGTVKVPLTSNEAQGSLRVILNRLNLPELVVNNILQESTLNKKIASDKINMYMNIFNHYVLPMLNANKPLITPQKLQQLRKLHQQRTVSKKLQKMQL